jgi:hypothetical protein
MTHEEKMGKTWRFITESGISEERPADYRVANIYEVRDAYYSDLETGAGVDDESIEDFFARHGILVIPDYCTQNDGDCKTCSLVNYGRDCMNNPIY